MRLPHLIACSIADIKQTLLFEVKWQGYEEVGDRTWEPEENLCATTHLLPGRADFRIAKRPPTCSRPTSRRSVAAPPTNLPPKGRNQRSAALKLSLQPHGQQQSLAEREANCRHHQNRLPPPPLLLARAEERRTALKTTGSLHLAHGRIMLLASTPSRRHLILSLASRIDSPT